MINCLNYSNRCFIGPPLALINAYNTVGIAILPQIQFLDLMLTAQPPYAGLLLRMPLH